MSGSLEVRKFLSQHDEIVPRRSSGMPAQRNRDESPMSPDQIHRARLTVASSARDAEDCRLLLDILGLVP